ncbi:MAG: WG repeat-containing protein [Zoogloeaceae bacterium]|jgi:hypothetical protein|nr:WG repeat-containing protein [Zoogloeaceae bacterium]
MQVFYAWLAITGGNFMKSMFVRGGILLGIFCFLTGCANIAAPFWYEQKYGLVSGEGKVIVQPELAYIGDFAANGLALAKTHEKHYGFMDTSGRLVIQPIFEDVNHAGFLGGALARVKAQGQWGDIDSKGNFFPLAEKRKSTAPESLARDSSRKNSLKKFEENGKFGLVDAEGKILVPPRFDAIDYFSSAGFATFRENRKRGLINDKAEILISPEFDGIATFYGISSWAKKDGRQGHIDQQGRFVFQYSEACGTATIVDRWNRIIWPPLSRAQICAESQKLSVNQAKIGDTLHVCVEVPSTRPDALCTIRLVDSREDEILVEYLEACTSQYKPSDQSWQLKRKVMPPEKRASCERRKTFSFSR